MTLFLRKPLKNVTPPKKIYRCGSGDTVMGTAKVYEMIAERVSSHVGEEILVAGPRNREPLPWTFSRSYRGLLSYELSSGVLWAAPVRGRGHIVLPMDGYAALSYEDGRVRVHRVRGPMRLTDKELATIMQEGYLFAAGDAEVQAALNCSRIKAEHRMLREHRGRPTKETGPEKIHSLLEEGLEERDRVGELYDRARRLRPETFPILTCDQ